MLVNLVLDMYVILFYGLPYKHLTTNFSRLTTRRRFCFQLKKLLLLFHLLSLLYICYYRNNKKTTKCFNCNTKTTKITKLE